MEESRLRDQEWDYERFWDGRGETARSRIETLDVVVHASDMTCMVKALLIERAKAIPIKFSCCLLLCHGVPVYDRVPPIFAWLHAADGSSSTPSPYAIPPRLV